MNHAMSPQRRAPIHLVWVAAFLALAFRAGTSLATEPASIDLIATAAEQGADSSQVLLAIAYLNGDDGRVQDMAKAAYWFEQAAIQGNAYAEERLGDLYEQGIGITKNPRLAFDWRMKAARRGSLDAQVKVGRMFQDGNGVGKDLDQAIYWFHRAAIEGNSEAHFLLEHLDHYGSDQEVDQAVGRTWFEAAAKRSYELAKQFMDVLDDVGYWVAENWYHRLPGLEKIARDGDLEAAYQLGRRYEKGTGGVARDYVAAIAWYQSAAQGNHTEAIRALNRLRANGDYGGHGHSEESARWALGTNATAVGPTAAGYLK